MGQTTQPTVSQHYRTMPVNGSKTKSKLKNVTKIFLKIYIKTKDTQVLGRQRAKPRSPSQSTDL